MENVSETGSETGSENEAEQEPCHPRHRRCVRCGAPHERRHLYALERGGALVACWSCQRQAALQRLLDRKPF